MLVSRVSVFDDYGHHPVEIAASMGVKIALIYLLGPQAIAVLVFEILLNGTALFNHANLRLPDRADRLLRLVLVTPDMHRVHHSVHRHEHDSNYGFALSVWDRIFRTYVPEPKAGHQDMTVGLEWQELLKPKTAVPTGHPVEVVVQARILLNLKVMVEIQLP